MAQSPLSSSVISSRWADDSASSSDDEIVWSIPSSFSPSSSSESDAEPHSESDRDVGAAAGTPSVRSDDDFILLSRVGSPSPELAAAMDALSLSTMTASTGFSLVSAVSQAPEKQSPAPTPAPAVKQPPTPASIKKKNKKAKKARAKARAEAKKQDQSQGQTQPKSPKKPKMVPTTPTQKSASALYPSPPASPAQDRSTARSRARSVIDDMSSVAESSADESDVESDSPAYTEAAKFMTSYLQNPPPPGNNGSLLLVLQALIVELGVPLSGKSKSTRKPKSAPAPQHTLALPALPRTVTQAKRLLKTAAFINIADYVAEREHGQSALRRVMHPSRASLVREIRGKKSSGAGSSEGGRPAGKRVPLSWAKSVGLNVLLVNTRW
ncbi:hypothetical protein DENSPDRAFT_837322 [Dentipellis sp. KUC8613]|nr:hypothetical protein DENSPDRAFT_837322 [Dentipellis sp. KUC8613]